MRALRTRENPSPTSHPFFATLLTFAAPSHHILTPRNSTLHTNQKKHSLFYDFFPLWGNIPPYTYRDARWRCAPFSFLLPQRKPTFKATFKANIQNNSKRIQTMKFQRIIFVVRRESGNFAH